MQHPSEILPRSRFDFLASGGAMAAAILAKDWSLTPLGALETWPESLRTIVSLCLASNFPISIAWGPGCVQIYNDGYWPICGAKHPHSMGQDFRECWRSAWPQIGPAFERAQAGETSYIEDQRIFIDRNGYLEETFFTFSFSPIRDESGGVGGLFHPVTETTGRLLSERRTRALRDLATRASKAKSGGEVCSIASEVLSDYSFDLPFVLLYLFNETGTQAHLAGATGIEWNTEGIPAAIDVQISSGSWLLLHPMNTAEPLLVDDLDRRLGAACGPYPESPKRALLCPILKPGMHRPTALLVAGISPRLPLDEPYKAFIDLLASHLANAFSNAEAYEEERRRAEKLAELDRAKTAFFSNVSHEFRTPLTLILGPVREILSRSGPEAVVTADREEVQLLERNATRLLKLVNGLLDFSRLEAGRVNAAYEPLDLSSVTGDVASVFRSAIERAGLRFVIDCPPLPAPVYLDREMWEKILLNLISNAFKFTFEGEIRVALRHSEEGPLVSVQDTGTGIPASELPQIFERFHRVEGAAGRTYEGTGIGLATVQELVSLHGGTVRAESQMGLGTKFTISLRYGSAHLAEERVSETAAARSTSLNAASFVEEAIQWPAKIAVPQADFSRPRLDRDAELDSKPPIKSRARVLLADDNTDMRDYVRRLLEDRFDVEAVANGVEALRSAGECIPDLVLSDVMMPGLDGFGLLRELRANARTAAVPIILLSARAGEESRLEGLAAGADDYLIKPFGARELLGRVQSNIELARLRREIASKEEERRAQAQIAQALRESEGRLQQLNAALDLSNACIRALDGTITFWCRGNERLYGWSREEAVGRTSHALLQTKFPKPLDEIEAELLQCGFWEGELLHRTKTGAEVWVASNWVLQVAEDGTPAAVVEVNNNISDRKRADEVSRHLASIVESSDDAIISKDLRGIVTSWNVGAERLFGYSAEEMIGKSVLTLFPGELLEEEIAIQARLHQGARIHHYETVRVAKSGRKIIVSLAVSPIYNALGEIIGASKILRDVSQKKELEEALRESEERLRIALQAGSIGIWESDLVTGASFLDANSRTIFGFPPAFEIRREAILSCIHPEDRVMAERNRAAFSDPAGTGRLATEFRILRWDDGRLRHVHFQGQMFFEGEGDNRRAVRSIGTMQDVTTLKQREEALRRTNRELEQFAYAAAHDLQEPLRNVALTTQLLATRYQDRLDSEAESLLRVASEEPRRMQAMVKDLLAFSRVLKCEEDAEPAADSNAALSLALKNLQLAIQEKRAEITSDNLPRVGMSELHLVQVFQNLVGNSLKYSGNMQPRVHVSSTHRDGLCVFVVQDNGLGIPPEYRERVFGVFKRLHDRSYPGTGIGLALCKRIVEHYGCKIWIESEGGHGATFLFSVPAVEMKGEPLVKL